MVLTVVGSEFAIVYMVFGLWVREKQKSKIWNREEGKYVLWVREKIQGEMVPEVGGKSSGFCDGKEKQ